MATPTLTEAVIRNHTDGTSFHRGREYYRRGAVVSLVRRGESLEAEVQGSEYEPYRVRVDFDASGVTEALCTCPDDWNGWCKHIVAALLTYLHQPEAAEVGPTLEQQLNALSREQLQTLLLELAARDPDLADRIEAQLALLRATHG